MRKNAGRTRAQLRRHERRCQRRRVRIAKQSRERRESRAQARSARVQWGAEQLRNMAAPLILRSRRREKKRRKERAKARRSIHLYSNHRPSKPTRKRTGSCGCRACTELPNALRPDTGREEYAS